MTPGRWREVERLFGAAVALDGDERAAVLAACADAELRAEVEALLAGVADQGRTLRDAIAAEAEALASSAVAGEIGRRIGPYRLIEALGEGGMGVVYRAARDDREYTRDVAIKILRMGLGSPHAIARFRDERQILARLDHPGIVRLLDGGRTDDGLPYLVMEHLRGVSITRYARDRGLSVPDRVRLILRVCEAVRFAHQRLVVHRDLKPSNILVGDDGVP
jgi:serine/threonine protein kinase